MTAAAPPDGKQRQPVSESDRETPRARKEDGGMIKRSAGVGGAERGNSWPLLERSEFERR